MHRLLPLLWFCVFHFGILSFCHGQGEPQPVQLKAPPVVPALQKPAHVPAAATLLDGTEINLRLVSQVKIKEVKVGDKVPFVLYHDLYYRDILLAKAGEAVEAEILDAVKARWASRGSKLAIDITGLRLLNGQTLPLRGYSLHNGGVGNAPRVADTAITTGSDIVCPMCKDHRSGGSWTLRLALQTRSLLQRHSPRASQCRSQIRTHTRSWLLPLRDKSQEDASTGLRRFGYKHESDRHV